MTRDRDYERPDDWFAARSRDPDPGTDDAAFEPDRRPTSDREQAEDAAAGFTWGLRPRAEALGGAAHGPTTREPVPVPAPTRRTPEPDPEPEAQPKPKPKPDPEPEAQPEPEPEGAAVIKPAARPFYPPPRVSSSNLGADPGADAPQSRALPRATPEFEPGNDPAPFDASLLGMPSLDPTPPVHDSPSASAADLPSMDEVLNAPSPRRAAREAAAREAAATGEPAIPAAMTDARPERIAATPVSFEAVPQQPAPLTPEASGWESLFGAGAADTTGPALPVLPPRGNVATPPAARPAESWIAHSRARQERRFTTRQLLITVLALLVVAVAVILLFALVRAGAQGVGPDVESLQIGTLIPGIG